MPTNTMSLIIDSAICTHSHTLSGCCAFVACPVITATAMNRMPISAHASTREA